MPAIQTTYNTRMAAGFPGLVRNMELANRISTTVEEAAGIGFGLPAVQGVTGVIAVGSSAYSAAGVAAAGNTGNGAITAAPAPLPGIKRGVYRAVAIGINKFELTDPAGIVVGTATVGMAWATQLGFTIAAGATAFAEGDQFNITVTATAGGIFRGLTIRDPTLVTLATANPPAAVDVYNKGQTADLLAGNGVMFITAGVSVAIGDPVFFNVAGQFYTNNPTDFPIPNSIFDSAATAGTLGLLRLGIT